jgi:hypothetical protein
VTKVNNNLSKEEIFSIASELEVDSEYSEEEEVLKETPRTPILKTSEQCKRSYDDNVLYCIVLYIYLVHISYI